MRETRLNVDTPCAQLLVVVYPQNPSKKPPAVEVVDLAAGEDGVAAVAAVDVVVAAQSVAFAVVAAELGDGAADAAVSLAVEELHHVQNDFASRMKSHEDPEEQDVSWQNHHVS